MKDRTHNKNNGYRYTAFISYSRKDTRIAKWLHKNLENFAPPRDIRKKYFIDSKNPFFPIILDEEELSVSVSLSDDIETALKDSKFLIVLCSPHAAASRWVNEEIRQFKIQGKSNDIIPVIIDGEPDAVVKGMKEEIECFPKNLCCYIDNDGFLSKSKAKLPLAADLRPSCLTEGRNILLTYSFWLKSYKRRRNGLLKIAAGLLKIKYDELKQRYRIHQRWQTTILTAISISLALIGILLVNASRQATYEKNRDSLNSFEQSAAYSGRYIDAALWNIELWQLARDNKTIFNDNSILSSVQFYLTRSPRLINYSHLADKERIVLCNEKNTSCLIYNSYSAGRKAVFS